MNDIAKRIAALSPEQRSLLELRLKQKGLSLNQTPSIPKRKASDKLPLSLAQERLWFLHQLQPNIPLYNESILFRLTGHIDTSVLEQSFNEIIRRHEIIRTSFQVVEGQSIQIVAPTLTIKLPIVDLENYSENERLAQVKQIVIEVSSRPFDLTLGPLLRGNLLRLNEKEHIMLLIMHHIISDGWSWKVLFQELAAVYQAFSSKVSSVLPELPIQYADFAIWQKQCLEDDKNAKDLTYWKQQLAGAPPVLDLPTDYPRPAVQSFRGARETIILSPSLTEALKSLSQKQGVTLFMLLLAAFKTLLYRYSRQDDILIGTPVANRNYTEIESLIGCFLNTLVLRSYLGDNPNFLQLLDRIRETTLAAFSHQNLPFEQLVKELQPERALSYSPLFQVMFVFQDAPLLALELPGLKLEPMMADSNISKFDLVLFLEDTKQGLIGALEYNTDLFTADRIRRMLGHFQTLLEGIVAYPEQRILNLPLLTVAEKQQQEQWNNTTTDYPQECIHQLFEARVEKTPDAVAVVFENQQLTYRELNAKANQLAHYLQKLGVGTEVLVGICLERSLEMLVALLGILKAGGAYVPLDPAYPADRIAFMLENAAVPVLLTQKKLLTSLAKHSAKIVCLDADWEEISQESDRNFKSNVTAENLAYVIYTSGSTGKPKGVQIQHGSLANFLSAMSQTLGLNGKDILLSVTTLSFDIAALELYLPLIVGIRLIVISRKITADGERLIEHLTKFQATIMQATPATWRLLLAAGWQGNRQLKILCGGEALDRELAHRLLDRSSEVWNLYGPTETTIWSAAHKLESNQAVISIGRPIANTQIYILDEQLQPVPIGVPGELHIGGVGLARGYLNRPDLTAEKFITNPFSKKPGSRLYKTGDLARFLPDGNIEYLGRIDNQIKLRGFRIELGEIEATLSQHPAVRETVVTVGEDASGNKRLVAYLVTNPQLPIASTVELRNYLKEKLPEYMIPSAFMLMDKLPLTANGKVDRRALPAIEKTQPELQETYVAPSTTLQEILAGIWGKILGLDRIGIHNNFFDLGGHSLLATQVISQIRKVFQVELPLRCLFESPTVASLAEQIQKATIASLPIQPSSRDKDLPLSFAQQRLWLLYQLDPDSTAYNGPTLVRLQGKLDVEALQTSINEIVRRHEVLRTCFAVVEGQSVQKIVSDLSVPLPIIDLQNLAECDRQAEVQRLTKENVQQPFDLTQAPLMRLTLLRLGSEEHLLLLITHHIISDAWSAGVFVREIAAFYQGLSLPELPIQYADFAIWQQQWLQGEVLETQLNYWKQQLSGAKTVLELPTDQPRSTSQSFAGGKHSFAFSPTLSRDIKSLCQREGVTLFMTLLAAFNALLYRYTKQTDILVGSPIANRNRSEIENSIGFFVNTLVWRTDLSNNPNFKELLQRVREVALGAYSHQDLPFEKLVAEIHPERSSDRNPLFQVWFVLQNTPMPSLEIPGLTFSFEEAFSGMVRHDLKLDLTETPAGITGFFEYKTDLFDASTIARMAELFETILTHVVQQPELRLNQIVEILDEAEKEQQILKNKELKQTRRQKLGSIGRKAITGISPEVEK